MKKALPAPRALGALSGAVIVLAALMVLLSATSWWPDDGLPCRRRTSA
jgi:hypothetical protein